MSKFVRYLYFCREHQDIILAAMVGFAFAIIIFTDGATQFISLLAIVLPVWITYLICWLKDIN